MTQDKQDGLLLVPGNYRGSRSKDWLQALWLCPFVGPLRSFVGAMH